MCGICGFICDSRLGIDKLETIKKMNEAIYHRGPDDEGYFVENNVALGVRRLSIIDLFHGHQPIYNENRMILIIFNGEIYNFKELRISLERNGHRFLTNTDTEVIVHLYEDFGFDCLKRLNGMFAFAIYDKTEDLLFMARDRLGIKPLHYYLDGKVLVFGSELKSLLQFPGLPQEIDLKSLNKYLTFEYVPAPYTIYKDIYKLPSGHYLIFKNSRLQIKRYWKLSYKDKPIKSKDECIEKLRWYIADSVRKRMISDVPLGVFLSGGIDSSLITAFMVRQSSHKVKTFNVSFGDESFDESRYARQIASYLETEHYEERLTPKMLLDLVPQIISVLDEPFADASVIPTYLLSKFTRESVTVALSGDGGDEVFAGYPTYQAHKMAHYFPKIIYPISKALVNWLPVSDDNITFDFKAKKFLSGIPYSPEIRNQIWLGSFEPFQKRKLFSVEVREYLKSDDEFDILSRSLHDCDADNYLEKILWLDTHFYLQDNMLVKVDRTSMANSLEVRVPYLDHRLVEFVCSLPADIKLNGLTTKYILKKAGRGLLPDEIIHRTKKGFGVPVAKWFKDELKDFVLDVLDERKIKREGVFNSKFIRGLLQDHFSGARDNRKLIWTLVVFELWREKFRTVKKVG